MDKSDKAKTLRKSVSYNKLYIKILAGVFVVLTVCGGISALFMLGGGSGQGAVFLSGRNCDVFVSQNEYGTYLIDNNTLIRLADRENLPTVESKTGKNEYSALVFKSADGFSVVYDGNFYYSRGFKYQMTGSVTAVQTEWVSDELIKASFPDQKPFWKNAVSFEEYGDYIYFLSTSQNNRLCKISKDGKTADYVGNIYTSSYLIIDGSLYYFDDGKVSGEPEGLYKSDSDGKKPELVMGKLSSNPDDKRKDAKLIESLYFHKGFIYFIDNSAKGDGHVCRMRPDGSEYKQISPDRAYTFTLDDEENLYYFTGKFGKFGGKLYSHKIGEDIQDYIYSEKSVDYVEHRPVWYKGHQVEYIYLKSSETGNRIKRLDLKKKTCELLTQDSEDSSYKWKTIQ